MQAGGRAIYSVCRTLSPLSQGILAGRYDKVRYVSTANISRSPSISNRSAQNSYTLSKRDPVKHITLPDALWPNDSCILPLPSGGKLSYARVGRSKELGQVWVLFHGTPGCRLRFSSIVDYAANNGIRLVIIDRPGYGYSTIHDRGIPGFMCDVEYLLNYLGVEQFKVYSVSGGGPYGLSAAYHFPKSRLLKTVIMCGATHPDFTETAVRIKWKIQMWLVARVPFWSLERNFQDQLAYEIYRAKGNREIKRKAILSTREEVRQDIKGYNNDIRLCKRPWGFDLQNIDANPIRWYHGSLGNEVKPRQGWGHGKQPRLRPHQIAPNPIQTN